MSQGNKPSAGAIIKLKSWEKMGLHGIFCEEQNWPWRPRTLGSDYVPEESKEGTVQKSMQRKGLKSHQLSLWKVSKGRQESSQDSGLWKEPTHIKLSRFSELSQPAMFANVAEAVATSPFVSFLSASPQHEQGTCGEPLAQGWIPCLGRVLHWPPHRPSHLPERRVGPRGATHRWCFGTPHVQPRKKQPQSPSGTIEKKC